MSELGGSFFNYMIACTGAGVVSVTNPKGVTQDYACWRTDFPGLDQLTVTVF